jgi:methyl-accepting chemotaxis protein
MPDIQNRRRQYLINKGFQVKTMLYLVALIVLTLAGSHGLALVTANWLGTGQTAARVAQTFTNVLPSTLPWEAALLPFLISLVLGTVVVLFLGLHYSHRIAGPLFNLKRVLAQVGNGDLTATMHIRTHDEFHDLEAAVNRMLEALHQRVSEVESAVQALPEPHRTRVQRSLAEAFPRPAPAKTAATKV